MPPSVHGRIYPETTSTILIRRDLRLLVDPAALTADGVAQLHEVDVLRHYLGDVPGAPCKISLLTPRSLVSDHPAEGRIIESLGGTIVGAPTEPSPEVLAALGDLRTERPDLPLLTTTALASDADIIITPNPLDSDVHDELARKIHITIGTFDQAKASCEIFARGHDVPWSFRAPAWGSPWTAFYAMTEPWETLLKLRDLAARKGIEPDTVEHLRSLALNRHANLCFTRDKLLFYGQQRRAAKRQRLESQDYAFEAGYFLNHYYLLLWGGLDQVCWIVNGIFGLGLTKKDHVRIGVRKKDFLRLLRDATPEVYRIYTDAAFVDWVKTTASVRHFVAHQGVATTQRLFLRRGPEPSDEEIDSAVNAREDWQQLKRMLGEGAEAAFRWRFRLEERIKHYDAVPEDVLHVEIEGKVGFIFPLLSVRWDFDHFITFAEQVAAVALTYLDGE